MDNREMLGKERVGKLLFKLALPAILAQLINMLYNLVDRLYIAQLHDDAAMAGIAVCMPVIMIVTAFSALVGMAGAPLASIELGKGDKDKAERIMNNSFVMLIVISVLLTIVTEAAADPILLLFGATSTALVPAREYIMIYAAGTIFVQLAMGLNSFIGTQGFSKTAMVSVVIGAVLNIALDPLFIFTFKMGVKGAALATIISQAVSAVWVVLFLVGKRTMLRLNWREMKPNAKIMLGIVALGVSPFIMQATESLVHISFNNGFKMYAGTEEQIDIALSGMSILCTAMQVMNMPLMGLAQGAQPIISFNYGARNMDRVKETFKYLLISSACFCGLIWILCMACPIIFAAPLATSKAVEEFGVWALRIFMAGTCLMCLQFSCQQSLVALGQAKVSLFLALFRKIIMLIPLCYLIPLMMPKGQEMTGLIMAEPIADATAAIVTSICFFFVFKKLSHKVKGELDREAMEPNTVAVDSNGVDGVANLDESDIEDVTTVDNMENTDNRVTIDANIADDVINADDVDDEKKED